MLRAISLLAVSTAIATIPLPAFAQERDDDSQVEADVIVTAARIRQGGAQDIKHFRNIAETDGMPRPESLTVEGLFGEHDLDLAAKGNCRQLLCLATEAMPADLPLRPDDKLFVGLGFTSSIDESKWRREPLNLVAVVDKSGSMDGQPLALVRASLEQIVGQMGKGDRISIVLYGDTSAVYLQPTDVGSDRGAVLAAIRNIRSAGSTNMEAGLQVGYATAFADAPGFKGNTRMMLFTDEQPNIGRTDATSFMGMARAASEQGIGLTTIGVGVQFDGALATKVSSARGGNLFFIANEGDVKTTFEKQLDTMVSEVAHDVRITMTPRAGYKLSGVFGVPDGLMTSGQEGSVSITVPTAFLSTNGGGIFASLAKTADLAFLPPAATGDGAPLMKVELSYVGAKDGKAGGDRLEVGSPAANPSTPLRKALLLVDEYLVLHDATTAYHVEGNPKKAYALLSGLDGRLASAPAGMDDERKLVAGMLQEAALFSGYGGELPARLRPKQVVGTWQIIRASGFEDLAKGDRLQFTPDREMMTFHRKTGYDEESESESYEINERQIHLTESRIVMSYTVDGKRLRMTVSDEKGTSSVVAERIDAEPVSRSL